VVFDQEPEKPTLGMSDIGYKVILYDGLYGKKQVFFKFLQVAQGYELIPVNPIGWL
jgi:hypothetical protein